MNSMKLGSALGLAILLGACGSEPTDAPTPNATQTVARVDPNSAPASFAMCQACHSIAPGENGIGPSLADIYNASAGKVSGFEYSPAMLASGIKWDDATLDEYLADPRKKVPGTMMSYAGMKDAAQRKEVIEFLKTL